MKAIFSSVMLALLLVGVFTAAFDVRLAKANANSQAATNTDWWPMSNHDPSHTGASTSKPPATNDTLWSDTVSDPIFSIAVVNNLVYAGAGIYSGGIYCLNAATGAQVWKYTTDGAMIGSPAIAGGVVFVDSTDEFYALNATTGTLIWDYGAGADSPTVVGNLVYLVGNGVYCLDAATGALVWQNPTGLSLTFSSPAVVGDMLYVGTNLNGVSCLNATNGSFIWNYTQGPYNYNQMGSPVVVNGLVYTGSHDDNVYCLDAATGALVWKYMTANFAEDPAIFNGLVYVNSYDNDTYCLNATTGAPVWTRSFTPDQTTSNLIVAGDTVFVGTWDENIYGLNATTGATVWNIQTHGSQVLSLAVANGVVYAGTWYAKVYALGLSSAPGLLWYLTLSLFIIAILLLILLAIFGLRRKRSKETQ